MENENKQMEPEELQEEALDEVTGGTAQIHAEAGLDLKLTVNASWP